MLADAERVARFWQAVETFSPRPLPAADVRENVVDVTAGVPLPWEAGGRLDGRAAGPGKAWRHQVFGGVFSLSRVRDALAALYADDVCDDMAPAGPAPGGESALMSCIVDASGVLLGEPELSECALALGRLAAARGEPWNWLDSAASPAYGSPPSGLPERPLTGTDLTGFASQLADELGVTGLLKPDRVRVRSYQVPAEAGQADCGSPRVLGSPYASDLAAVAAALRDGSAVGAALADFLRSAGGSGASGSGAGDEDGAVEISRVDVRREPLAVRDGCAPDRMPPGRWPADAPLALSEQFAVNAITGRLTSSPGLFAVHAPDGTGTTAVFSDLIAAIFTQRACRLADLPSPRAAFGTQHTWGAHKITAPAPALTGFEIVLASPDRAPDVPTAGPKWRGRATEADYFTSAARLAYGDRAWAMITARLGERTQRRTFVERFWHGTVRGTDVLLPAGEHMPAALRRGPSAGWRAAVARFREAMATVRSLSAERSTASAALTRLSALEQACEEASSAFEAARARCADLADREPLATGKVVAAEERRRACLADLEAHQRDKPGLMVALSTRLRAGRDWYAAHGELRAAYLEAARQRDEALGAAQSLRADLAAAHKTAADMEEQVSMLAGEMTPLQETVADARRRWPDHVPDGPSYAETEDAALIERRENSAAWADEAFAAARTELFLAALELHKALITAEADTVEANLAALMDMLSAVDSPSPPTLPPEAALAAWQSFFLVVPTVSTTFDSLGPLLAGLGRGSVGWLLADGAGRVPPQHLAGALWRANRAVLAGDAVPARPAGLLPWGGERALAKAFGVREESAPGRTCAQRVADQLARYGTWLPSGAERMWVAVPLRVQRQRDRSIVDTCNELGYDGLMVPGNPDMGSFPGLDTWYDARPGREEEALRAALVSLREAGVPASGVRVVSPSADAAAASAAAYREVFGETGDGRAGTVHSVPDGDVVVLLLGCDPLAPDAHAFAAASPNLLCAAVSLARHRLYVIGDRRAWAADPRVAVLARRLAVRPG